MPARGRPLRRKRDYEARRIVRQLAAKTAAPPEALETLERALQRGPIADPAGYLARIVRHLEDGKEQIVVLPERTAALARAEESASAPGLFDGHRVGGYRSAPRNGQVRSAHAEEG